MADLTPEVLATLHDESPEPVFVFVPVYIDQKTVASTPPHRRNLLLKLRRIFLRGDRRSLLPFWTWFIDNPRPASLK